MSAPPSSPRARFAPAHHIISEVGLIGGGQRPLPGEGSLAHHGILFVDERPACTRQALEVWRPPLEEGLSNNHGAYIADVVALAVLAARVKAAPGI